MRSNSKRAIVAFTVAPFVPTCLYWTCFCIRARSDVYAAGFLRESVAPVFWTRSEPVVL